MEPKVPLPGRLQSASIQAGADRITISCEKISDCDGNHAAGYNLYRSTTSGTGYEKVNPSLITGTSYQDEDVSLGMIYYYVLSAVDMASLESGYSAEASPAAGSGASGGCFIAAASGRSLGE